MKAHPDWQKLARFLSRYKYVALIFCAGLLLLALPRGSSNRASAPAVSASTQNEDASFDVEALERKLEEALSQINGVGEATVLLTLKSSPESVLAQDTTQGNSLEQETVILSKGSGTQEAVSVKTIYPAFQGALVVCDGANSPSVKLEVLKAVSAITGLSSDQISICLRK